MLFNSLIKINIKIESRLHCIDIIAYHCSWTFSVYAINQIEMLTDVKWKISENTVNETSFVFTL